MMKRTILLTLCLAAAGTMALAQQPEYRPMDDENKVVDLTLDSLEKVRTARPKAGSSRKGNNPVLFLVGNSTMRTGTLGNGDNGQWGWGFFAHNYFDEERITVENQALGGTSSRTFYNQLWPDVKKGIRPGDWVVIELGHNDNGPFDLTLALRLPSGIPAVVFLTAEDEFGLAVIDEALFAELKDSPALPIYSSGDVIAAPRGEWLRITDLRDDLPAANYIGIP